MANSGLQMLGYALGMCGWIAIIAATGLPQWRTSAYAGEVIITAVSIYEGLFMSCASQSTGQIQCKIFDSLLALPTRVQITRALMICSIVVGLFALGVSAVGMKCTRMGSDNKTRKNRFAILGGVVFLVAGLLCLSGTSYYAAEIAREFYSPLTPVQARYEFGQALFVGWVGACLVLMGGAFLCCSCSSKPSGKKSRPRGPPRHGPPRSKGSGRTDYV
ncbi:claudin-19 [Petromyzon marinus]|uniref:Claudin 1 n=2 Tax=Petromyzon marinus TaxID=7757 RepID=S4RU87_PETMA|nr:claudin-19-like [Petromyzon marinus]XP_032816446.1 claudin-19-like [Petromyzon marinus]XP_032816454.1 claudin-19-like [Petromyzon marinus]AKQ44365.1 claudin 19b [Petromyzon marinus]